MQPCPQCHFTPASPAERCGYCGALLPPVSAASPYPGTTTLPAPPPPASAYPRDMGGISAMHASPATLTLDPPTNTPTQANYPSWSVPTGYVPMTAAHVTGLAAAPHSLPRPTPKSRPQRWWLAILPLTLLAAWGLAAGQATWNQALLSASRAIFAGVVALGCAGLVAWHTRRDWHKFIAPCIIATFLLCLGIGMIAAAQPALQLQARMDENGGDYAHAVTLFQRAGSGTDAARSQLEWGQTLIDQNNFVAAQTHIQMALDASQGPLHDAARVAIGQLLWRWGQALQAQGDPANTRLKWQAAAQLAADTPAGIAATQALAAPQIVTGHLTWLGSPIPGLRVALVTNWKFTSDFHILQVTGERLPATTGDDGSFTISGVRPGITYTLIWHGTFGDTTATDANNQALYTITLEPLQGADMGKLPIDPTPSPGHYGHGAAGNGN